eukprot:CAMPEP_0194285804 /NCGR_PEP_ID=MMETSP0169-20130528/31080_1 /TAXON_ID=218684 /ORGANISM="Corethron pennatum, Strain L29A3" /LENGTH=581 /DNA_ID=CAMNT_0039032021 /DNA_START=97 /DNA_END=1842 /DNA_ORIENTATION=-
MTFSRRMTAFSRGMTYCTPKFAMIYDWRIAALNYVLKLIVAIYVVTQIFRGNQYLKKVIPLGSVTNYASVNMKGAKISTTYLPVQAASYKQTTLGSEIFGNVTSAVLPCAGPMEDYKFAYDADNYYSNVKCAYFLPDELITKEPTGAMFITTHRNELVAYRYVSEGECNATHTFADGTVVELSPDYSEGKCYYEKSVDWIAVGAEHISVGIVHREKFLDQQSNRNPKTIVRLKNSDVNLMEFEQGKAIQLTVAEILNFTNIDLDKRNEEYDSGVGADEDRKPVPRLAGLRMSMNIMYYNFDLHQSTMKQGGSQIYAILEIDPTFEWTSQGQKITYRSERDNLNDPIMADGRPKGYILNNYNYGINFDIRTGGEVGTFSWNTLLNVFIAGAVLAGSTSAFCDLVAKYGLGGKSKIYKRAMLEEVDFKREAAKFAIEGMQAHDQYDKLDTSEACDGISLDELHQKLVDTYCVTRGVEESSIEAAKKFTLTEDECRVLAMYIMLTGDRDSKAQFLAGMPRSTMEELKKRSLDMPEWTDLFTGGKMDVLIIKDCIKDDVKHNAEEMRNSTPALETVSGGAAKTGM